MRIVCKRRRGNDNVLIYVDPVLSSPAQTVPGLRQHALMMSSHHKILNHI